ncbi:MAG: ABC transporter permease [Chloroflexota bacterium]
MNTIRTIVQNDLMIYFSQRGNLIGLIILPIAFTVMLGWAFSDSGGDGGPQRVRVDVLDEDQSEASAYLLTELRKANEALVLCPMDNDTDDFCQLGEEVLTIEMGKERAQEERTDAFLLIPAGYEESFERFEQVEIQFYAAGNPGLPNAIQQTLSNVLEKLNGASTTANVANALLDGLGEQTGLRSVIEPFQPALVQAIYQDATERINSKEDPVRYETTTGEELDTPDQGFGQSIPGMGTMYVMFTVLAATSVLMRERNQWTLQRLAALPISRATILSGKIITYFILGMIQFLIIFAVGLLVGLDFGSQPLNLFLIMMAFVLCITALAFAIAPWMKNQAQAGGVSRLLALAFAPLGGAWWPLEIVPDFMRTIGHLSPVAWAMDAFHDIMWYSGGFLEIIPELGVLLGAAAVLFGIGVRGFKYV